MTRKSFASHALAAALAIAFPLQSLAAFDAFLKLDGIEGEATAKGHENEIVVDSFSMGASRTGSIGGAGKVCVSDISLVKMIDKASVKLLAAALNGTHLKEGTITVRKAGGGASQQDYLVITLQDILVTSVTHNSGGDLPVEAVSLNYGALTFSYRQQKDDGSLLPAVQTSYAAPKC